MEQAPAQTKTWDLSLYELNRTPQEAITDDTVISVSPRSLHSELMCPICLDMLKSTMTTKECLHRFCNECIITALRSGNKECPTCRKKLVSKRSLRPDPNFDNLIAKIFPSRDEYDAHQEKLLQKAKQTMAVYNRSVDEGLRIQNRQTPFAGRKQTGTPVEGTPNKRRRLSNESCDQSLAGSDAADHSALGVAMTGEIELIFKPHPREGVPASAATTRFLKTTGNATGKKCIQFVIYLNFTAMNGVFVSN